MILSYDVSTIGTLKTLINSGKKPILLLGAGCSIKSGIPTASVFVEKAGKWGYARENGISIEHPSIRRSDWQPWLESKSWYKNSLSLADNYPLVVENILQPRAARRQFLRSVLNPQVPPSRGYSCLADLIGLRVFETILTTNFDNLIDVSCSSSRLVHGHQVIKSSADIVKISTNPEYAQIIALHGDIEAYTDKNLTDETNKLDPKLVDRLVPILRDNPIIVIGYRGAEKSIMGDLLLSRIEEAENFNNGIYWCHYDKSSLEDIPTKVVDLKSAIGTNFQLIKSSSFDDILMELWNNYDHSISNYQIPKEAFSNAYKIHDLTTVLGTDLSMLDMSLLRARAKQYCQSLKIELPNELSDSWLSNFQLERDLAVFLKVENESVPTYAGLKLFTKTEFEKNCHVELSIDPDFEWLKYTLNLDSIEEAKEVELNYKVIGNLWDQLEEIMDVLSQFNKPFRLKGEISKNVTPYSPLALKELVVNALVHRDYQIKEPIKILISPENIMITNPGGITVQLAESLHGKDIFNEIKNGIKGHKSYRNPVLADFFYGSGAMDKAGSGLHDVYKIIQSYNSNLSFGPDENNEIFQVKIYARPEIIEYQTSTAHDEKLNSSTFLSNTLEFLEIPKTIYIGKFDKRFDYKEFWESHKGVSMPPMQFYGKEVISFYPFIADINPIANFLETHSLVSYNRDEFESIDKGRNTLIKLLNKSVQDHFRSMGLVVDWKKQRAYFPKEEDANRTISYQARIKKATRTVARQKFHSKTEKLLYWEHKSVNYHIKKLDGVYALVLLPGYVFTVDGERWLVKSEKISKLATRKSSIDYNKSVLNDLFFWIYILSSGTNKSFWLKLSCDVSSELNCIQLSSSFPKTTFDGSLDKNEFGESEYYDSFELDDELEKEIDIYRLKEK